MAYEGLYPNDEFGGGYSGGGGGMGALGGLLGGGGGSSLGGGLASIAVLLGAGGKGGIAERKKIVDLWNKLETSNFDYKSLTFPELVMVSRMMPEVYDAVVPPEVKTVVEDPQVTQAQMTALGQMQDIAAQGMPLQDRLQARAIQDEASAANNRITNASLRQLAARGNLGAGDETQFRALAGAAGANAAGDASARVINDALNRRYAAIGASGNMAGDIRRANLASGMYNASAINNFNQQMADIRNEAARYAAGARERAQGYNVGTAQSLATQTQLGRQGLEEREKDRTNTLKNTSYQEQLQKLYGQTAAYGGLANYKDRDRAAKEQAIIGAGKGLGGSLGFLGLL